MPESTRSRECRHDKDTAALFAKSKRICLPIERAEYERIVRDKVAFRQYLDGQIAQHPELFPATIQQGYQLHDLLPPSKKLPNLRLRRIQVAAAENGEEVFSVAPSFVMPCFFGMPPEIPAGVLETMTGYLQGLKATCISFDVACRFRRARR